MLSFQFRTTFLATTLASFLSFGATSAGTFTGSGIFICAEHADQDDWNSEFAGGPVVVPAGTVFGYGGHILDGNLQDPKESAHFTTSGWIGVSSEESERRARLSAQDMAVDPKNTSAVATLQPVTLTKLAPCAVAPGEAILSTNWGWVVSPIVGDPSLYYEVFGVIRRGALDTNFDDDTVPLNFLAGRGELFASVRGTLTKTLRLDQWSASLPPDEMPVEGNENSECWGDDTRQDVTCRALTERFLLSMRGATKADVIKAMNVTGREIDGGLHFLSNYSRGDRSGSGDVNFKFDPKGLVSVIFAIIDSASANGTHADFIWNAESLPAGCSDVPGTTMTHCN